MGAGTGLAAVLGDLDPGSAAFEQVSCVRWHRGPCLVRVDGCNRAGNGEPALCTVAGGDDFLQYRRLAIQREDDRNRAVVGNGYDLNRSGEADAARANRLRSCWYSANGEGAIGCGDRTAARAFDEHADIGDRLLSPGVNDSSCNGTGGRNRGLCAQNGRQ